MRKLLVSLAAAGTVMTLATPASAQWHRPGYASNGALANLQRDVQQIRIDRDNLARSGRLTGREARDLDNDIRSTEININKAARRGVAPYQVRELQGRVYRLRQELRQYSDYDHGGRRRWR